VSLRAFVAELPEPERSLVVVNRTEPRAVQDLLEATFPNGDLPVMEASLPDVEADTVALVEDGTVVETSPLAALEEQLLFVNSDLFKTGTRDLEEVRLPDVLLGLDDVPFRLRGYPESNREKLVLIAVSRLIERRALECATGTLRTAFQQFSRIADERGTRFVYERLAQTDVDVHLYGVPDDVPAPELYSVLHAGRSRPFRRSWFVVHRPHDGEAAPAGGEPATREDEPTTADDKTILEDDEPATAADEPTAADGTGPAALVALETEPRTWSGFWTFDAERVRRIDRHVQRHL